jgi:hypothetical protein
VKSRGNQHRLWVVIFALSTIGCTERKNDARTANPSPNAAILEEVNHSQSWFRAKKNRPIWARQLDKDETVKTLEGTEQVKAGDFLCRGEAGDIWPQASKSLNEKYQKTEEVDSNGWRKYVPRPDNEGVMAAQVTHPFVVHAKWGVLSGKRGDYIVKSFADRDVSYPEDVWIVDQTLFQATYKAIETER